MTNESSVNQTNQSVISLYLHEFSEVTEWWYHEQCWVFRRLSCRIPRRSHADQGEWPQIDALPEEQPNQLTLSTTHIDLRHGEIEEYLYCEANRIWLNRRYRELSRYWISSFEHCKSLSSISTLRERWLTIVSLIVHVVLHRLKHRSQVSEWYSRVLARTKIDWSKCYFEETFLFYLTLRSVIVRWAERLFRRYSPRSFGRSKRDFSWNPLR